MVQRRPAKLDLAGPSRDDVFGSWNNERARTTTTLVNGRFTVNSMIDSRHTESQSVDESFAEVAWDVVAEVNRTGDYALANTR